MTARHPMTLKGLARLQAELEDLKKVKRPQIIQAIAVARANGDLKENADYHAAREEQSFTEGRILELEAKLSHAQVIDVTKLPNNGKVIFGTTVRLCHLEMQEEIYYQIVGEDEADLKERKISFSSPIARALIAKEVGDIVEVNTPGGIVEYEIVAVDYIG